MEQQQTEAEPVAGPNWVVRKARPTDMALVYDNWLESFKYGDMVQDVTRHNRDMYFRYWRRVVDELIENSTTIVMANKVWDEERKAWNDDQVVGWACGQRCAENILLLHYVYTKGPFRYNGIARKLVSLFAANQRGQGMATSIVYTHKTGPGRKALEHELRTRPEAYPSIVAWNPFGPFDPLPREWTHSVTAVKGYSDE